MFNLSDLEEGARDSRREHDQETVVRKLLRRRQRNINPGGHLVVTSVLGGVALLMWGSIYADARHDPAEVLTTGYAAFLAIAISLGICAAAAGAAWSSVRDARRRAAEEDVIREFHQQQQLDAIRDAVAVFLREGNRETHGALSVVQDLIDRSDRSNVAKFPRAHS